MAAVAQYLIDKSALVRLGKAPVDARLVPLLTRGLVAVCGIVELEMLYSARNPDDYARRRQQLRLGFEWLAMPDEVWQTAIDTQQEFARQGSHRGIPLPDLLVAATAARHGVTVLHYDTDYDAIAAVTGQPTEWVVPPGAAE